MRITGIDTVRLSRMHEPDRQWFTGTYRTVKADCAIVVVSTDSEEVGIGEAAAYGWPDKIQSWVSWLRPLLIGRDPLDPATALPPGLGTERPYDCAVAAIDCALWDLRGRASGRRVAELIDPAAADSVRLYASAGVRYDWATDPKQLVDEAIGLAEQGWTAYKFRIGTEWEWDCVDAGRFLTLAGDVAAAVGDRMQLMVDANQRLDRLAALTVARGLDELGFAWFEEPLPQADIEGYELLNQGVRMPITGGERFTSVREFRPYLERGAYAIVQPDAGICGITECLRIAEMARYHGAEFCPHGWHNGLMAMAHAHLMAGLRATHPVELCTVQGPLQWEILADPPEIRGGRLALPSAPGLGVTLAPDLEQRFPYLEGHYAVVVER
ncbi:MAG TPA: mandelate racemase/muconate lactonizing enzyme family protein [Pilimelia sp.]|nr:mandelate racemase/muconate lactonizing enzyme family protein [Pilimelia sp.]